MTDITKSPAGLDIYQDLEYIIQDVVDSIDLQSVLMINSTDEKEAIIDVCITTLRGIYDSLDEAPLRTFVDNNLQARKVSSRKIPIRRKSASGSDSDSTLSGSGSDSEVDTSKSPKSENDDFPIASKQFLEQFLRAADPVVTASTLSPKRTPPKRTKARARSRTSTPPLHLPPTTSAFAPMDGNDQPTESFESKLARFRAMPKYAQKSPEWLAQRNNYLTASTIAAALGLAGPVARRDLMVNKVSMGTTKGFTGNCATHWGNKYEPVANAIYAHRQNVMIHEFGMLTNAKYPILGVSPDGILEDRMLEIKCPYTRVIDGKIKNEYYHQMQEQMAVCEFRICDFLECRFEEMMEERFWDDFYYYDSRDNINREKGVIISYFNIDPAGPGLEYLYSPIALHTDASALRQWIQQQLDALHVDPTRIYLQCSHWQLLVYSCQGVVQDPQWIINNYPILKSFWDEVERHRKEGLDQLLQRIEKDKIHDRDDDEADNQDMLSGLRKITGHLALVSPVNKPTSANAKKSVSRKTTPTSQSRCLLD